jgi:hypothetical protein
MDFQQPMVEVIHCLYSNHFVCIQNCAFISSKEIMANNKIMESIISHQTLH